MIELLLCISLGTEGFILWETMLFKNHRVKDKGVIENTHF